MDISLGITGHRPEKLGGWRTYRSFTLGRLTDQAVAFITHSESSGYRVKELISGMAPGWDTACAMAALELHIPLIAAVPFEGQHDKWQDIEQELYFELLAQATEVHHLSEPGYSSEKMLIRNRWIVDRCDWLAALLNEAEAGQFSGTGQCVRYAKSKKKTVYNLWKNWIKYKDSN